MTMDEISRTAEYNVFWEDTNELEFDGWVSRELAESRVAEIYADPAKVEREYGIDPEQLRDTVLLVRRWRTVFIDDDWDYLRNQVAEELADDERELAAEVRLTLND